MDKKYRLFSGVLYPDSESYVCEEILTIITQKFSEWAYILHDKDIDDDGNPKKLHYHWIGKGDPRTISAVSKFLGIPEHDIEIGKSFPLLVQYLIHQNNQEKYQYSSDDISHNISQISKYLRKRSEGEYVLDLIEVKRNNSWYSTVTWASYNQCYDVLRRNIGIIKIVTDEINGKTEI